MVSITTNFKKDSKLNWIMQILNSLFYIMHCFTLSLRHTHSHPLRSTHVYRETHTHTATHTHTERPSVLLEQQAKEWRTTVQWSPHMLKAAPTTNQIHETNQARDVKCLPTKQTRFKYIRENNLQVFFLLYPNTFIGLCYTVNSRWKWSGGLTWGLFVAWDHMI